MGYTPEFSAVPQRLTWCQRFDLQLLAIQICVRQNIPFCVVFFFREKNLQPFPETYVAQEPSKCMLRFIRSNVTPWDRVDIIKGNQAIWYYSSIFCKWWDLGGMSSFYTEIGGIHPTGQNSYLHVESKS